MQLRMGIQCFGGGPRPLGNSIFEYMKEDGRTTLRLAYREIVTIGDAWTWLRNVFNKH
jgi:hypothetical protein